MRTFLDLPRVARGCERREFMIYTTYTKKPDKICAKRQQHFILKHLTNQSKESIISTERERERRYIQ